MTYGRLALASLAHDRRTHAAVALGVASAVAVLAGSLLVGASVRSSLGSIATSRLGRAEVVIAAEQPFTEPLAARLHDALDVPVAPMLALTAFARHDSSGRRAGSVAIYGVDARFFALHGVTDATPAGSQALVSPDLAGELGAAPGDTLLVRVARPTDIPLDSLHGHRDDVGRTIRLTVAGTLDRDRQGEFSLTPGQGPVRSVFVALDRLQRDLGLRGRANTLLIGGGSGAVAGVREALSSRLAPDDLGLKLTQIDTASTAVVESASGLINDALADTIERVAGRGRVVTTPVLTWLATAMTVRDRRVPYSLVTALGDDAAGDARMARLLTAAPAGTAPPLVLNEWSAQDLQATTGDSVELEYYRWADEGRLVTDRTTFRVAGVVPMEGLATDRRLAPEYPGITTAGRLSEWDPPFPIDLNLVRPRDEDYWDRYRTAPKAFIALADGQRLWRTRHGQLTSIRIRGIDGAPPDSRFLEAVARAVNPSAAGLSVVDVKARAAAASAGATDFGAYFSYFSAFLMVSALLLAALFFRLMLEQRLAQVGVLRACGFTVANVRRALLAEGAVVAAAGSALGVVFAIGWAALMMYGLRTWWADAVGTTLLRLHVDAASLAIGAGGGLLAALLSIAITARAISRATPRDLLSGHIAPAAAGSSRRRAGRLALVAGLAALALSLLSLSGYVPPAAGFFGAGALALVAGLAGVRARLMRPPARAPRLDGLAALGARNASWRPNRTLTAAGLVAAAVFLLVSVEAFRLPTTADLSPQSGTGGFALIAESVLPIVHDLSTPAGREAAGLSVGTDAGGLADVDIVGLRLRPGDDASCLNLYQPKQPRVVGVPDRLVRERRFSFAASTAATDEARANPWTLLGPADGAGIVPAIVDRTSLQYVLHASVGDVLTIDADSARPVRLRIVASLDDSVLQGELMVADEAFRQLFPEIAGYRVFLVSVGAADAERIAGVASRLEEDLDVYGFDAQETTRRIAAYHRVENTYLSTFQALGGLGLVLGCLGLIAIIARNVLERRRELALLGAAGFTGRDLQRVVAIEHLLILAAGLAIGVLAAAVAIAPVLAARGAGAPFGALVWIGPVVAAGLVAAFGTTRGLRRLPLVASLRSE